MSCYFNCRLPRIPFGDVLPQQAPSDDSLLRLLGRRSLHRWIWGFIVQWSRPYSKNYVRMTKSFGMWLENGEMLEKPMVGFPHVTLSEAMLLEWLGTGLILFRGPRTIYFRVLVTTSKSILFRIGWERRKKKTEENERKKTEGDWAQIQKISAHLQNTV